MPNQQFNEGAPIARVYSVPAFVGPGALQVAQAGLTPLRIDSISATSDDVVDHVVMVQLQTDVGITGTLGAATVPAGSGTGASPAIELVAACATGNVLGILIPPGYSLLLFSADTWGGSATWSGVVQGGAL